MSEKEAQDHYLIESVNTIISTWKYLQKKWKLLFLSAFLFGCIGILYAWLQKPVYVAEITFAPENDNSSRMSGYAGIAAQFGIDIGGSGGGAFEGDNLSEFLKSRMLIEKTLLTPVQVGNKNELLINYYIISKKYNKDWGKRKDLQALDFHNAGKERDRNRDSVIKKIITQLSQSFTIEKIDKKLDILSAKMKDEDEFFAKTFVEKLVENGISYYTDYKSKKSQQNVSILQHQADSVKGLLTGNIVSVATTTDLNVNPLRQIGRASVQRKQVDVQVNSQLYGELLKQLELSKIALRRETPFIQIIDTPDYPLEKKKLGRLTAGIIFSFIGSILTILFITTRFIMKQYLEKLKKI